MSALVGRYHVVSNRAGRILALGPARAARTAEGTEMGWRFVAGPGQLVAEVELTEAHAGLDADELIEAFTVRVDRKTGRALLERRTGARGKKTPAKRRR